MKRIGLIAVCFGWLGPGAAMAEISSYDALTAAGCTGQMDGYAVDAEPYGPDAAQMARDQADRTLAALIAAGGDTDALMAARRQGAADWAARSRALRQSGMRGEIWDAHVQASITCGAVFDRLRAAGIPE